MTRRRRGGQDGSAADGFDSPQATCEADPGSNSGVPEEPGLDPDDAVLATGARHQELGPLDQTTDPT